MFWSRIRLAVVAVGLVLGLSVAPAAAGVALTVKPGEWCDVVLHPDGFAFVRQVGSTIVAEVNGTERWRVTLPEPTLYLRAATAPNGAILALGQSASGRALVTIDGAPAQDYGVAFGQNAVLAWHDGTRFVIWIQRSPDAATRTEIGGAEALVQLPWTSQGFRDVTETGTPLLGDQWFQRTIRGRSIHEPVFRANLWAGQWSDGPPGIGVLADDRDLAFTAIPGLGFEPHFARAGDRLAVAARTPAGAALAIVTPPYPPNDGVITPPVVVPPVIVPPKPVDPPQTVQVPNYRDELAQLRRKYPTPMSNPEQAALLNELAWAHRAEGFGLEAKPGGNHCPQPTTGILVGCDILRFDAHGVSVGMDVLGDTEGAGTVGWGDPGPADPARFVAPVAPTTTPPDPIDPPKPTGGPTLADLLARLDTLAQSLVDLRSEMNGQLSEQGTVYNRRLDEVLAALGELKRQPITFPEYNGKVLGQPITLRPKQ